MINIALAERGEKSVWLACSPRRTGDNTVQDTIFIYSARCFSHLSHHGWLRLVSQLTRGGAITVELKDKALRTKELTDNARIVAYS